MRSRIAVPQEVYRIGQVSLLQRPRQEETPLWETEREGSASILMASTTSVPPSLPEGYGSDLGSSYSMRHTAATYSAPSELLRSMAFHPQLVPTAPSADSTPPELRDHDEPGTDEEHQWRHRRYQFLRKPRCE